METRVDLSTIEAVVFDFDGTLAETRIDFAKMRRLILELCRKWGVWEEGMDEGKYILEVIADGKAKLGDDSPSAVQFGAEAAAVLEQVELETCASAEPFPGVVEALQELHERGYKVGIVTRNCRAGVASVTARHHLYHDVLSTRDDVQRVKPDPAHFREAVAALGVRPEHAVMIGDHHSDIEGTYGTGALAFGVLTQKTTRERFEEVGADMVFPDVPSAVEAIVRGKQDE